MYYNRGPYNIGSFNVPEVAPDIEFNDFVFQNIRGVIVLGSDLNFSDRINQQLSSSIFVATGLPFSQFLEQELTGNGTYNTWSVFVDTPLNTLGGIGDVYKFMPIQDKAENNIIGSSPLYKFMPIQDNSYNQLNAPIMVASYLYYNDNSSNIVIGSTDLATVIFEYIDIDVLIKPGETITIDSDVFDVFKDKQSIIYSHRGDWVFLSRDVEFIELRFGIAGTHSSKILYTERYL